MRKRVFIDMDGVLCEYRLDVDVEDMKQRGFFRLLRPREETVSAVRAFIARDLADVYILSSVFPETQAESTAEKNAWLDEFLPEILPDHRIFTLCGKSKAEAVENLSADDILIDDYSSNLVSWVASGGKGIKLLNEVNGRNGTYRFGPRVRICEEENLCKAVMEA